MANTKYISNDNNAGAIPVDTTIRTTLSTEAGQTNAQIQHVRIDDGAGNSPGIAARAQTPTGNALQVQIGPGDVISYIPVMIDYAHHQIHEGETYQYTYAPAALGSGSSVDLLLTVPDVAATTRTPHLICETAATVETWAYLYEEPTTSDAGTPQTIYNKNRNSTDTAGMTISLGPTVDATGNMLSAWIIGSGLRSGGGSRDTNEWDLKANTKYLYRVTAKAASDDIVIRLEWYEDKGV